MGKSCAALGCSNGIAGSKLEDSNISFHKFPLRHPQLLEVWTSRTGRRPGAFAPTEHSRLCSRHFARADFINPDAPKARRLRDDTIPSLNLPGFPVGEGVGGGTLPSTEPEEDPRIHATMVPPDASRAIPKALPPSQLRKLAHKLQAADAADANMDPVLRETWDVLMSDGDFPTPNVTNESDVSQEEKVMRMKPQLWPQAMQQQHQQQQHQHQHQHHHHHTHQQPQQSATGTSNEESAELLEEQEQQMEHSSSRGFQTAGSPQIVGEPFSQPISDSLAGSEDYQPPTKKQFLHTHPQITCHLDNLNVHQPTPLSQDSAVNVHSFECPSHPSAAPHQAHLPMPFDLARQARSLLQTAALTVTTKQRGGTNGFKTSHREKNTHLSALAAPIAPASPWDGLWSDLGRAVRSVAEGVANFLRTKADIARERHQIEMERRRRKLPSPKDWDSGPASQPVNGDACEHPEQGHCPNGEPNGDSPK